MRGLVEGLGLITPLKAVRMEGSRGGIPGRGGGLTRELRVSLDGDWK